MQFLRSVLGTGGSTNEFPYSIGEAYSSAWGSWSHNAGTIKEDGSAVSVFSITGANPQDAKLTPARNGAKRLRTLRHPNVLSFTNSLEVEKEEGGTKKPTLYVITEPVVPLEQKLKELNLKGTQRDEYYAWGLLQIAKAVSFLNNDCKLVHGNICAAAVVVTPTLDWKLHAFDVLSEFDGGNADAQGPMLPFEFMVGNQYKAMEVAKGDWAAVRRGPPHAIDAWGLGCLIQEVFSGASLSRTEDLRSTACIPKSLLPDYQRLLSSAPSRRLNPSKLVDNGEFFQNKLVDTVQFMEVLSLKDSVEKDTFFRKFPTLCEQLPRPILIRKVLPLLCSALEFGSAPSAGLQCLLRLGSWLPQDEFNAKILPTLVKLFGSADRGIRVALLQNLETFAAALAPNVVDEQIFNHITTGFSDTSAFVRELTLKSMLLLAPKMSQRTLNGSLLKFLSKLQVDEEPAIRTNTTILLGNISRHLTDATRKRVLINAFTARALRDVFPPARSAGIMALMATREYYDINEIGTRILPPLVILVVDADIDVRTKAQQASLAFLQSVSKFYNKGESGAPSSHDTSTAAPTAQSSGMLGWAVSSVSSNKPSNSPVLQPDSSASGAHIESMSIPSPATPLGAASSAAAASSMLAQEPEEDAFSTASKFSSPPLRGAVGAPSRSSRSSHESRAEVEAETTVDEDADGWDDLEDEEEAAVPAKAALSRIQAAQQRPVVTAQPTGVTAGSSNILGSKPAGAASANATAVKKPLGVTRPAGATGSATAAPQRSAVTTSSAAPKSDNLFASIAAPAPVSSARPVAGLGAGRGRGTAAARSSVGASGHVQLPTGSGGMDLESMLGNDMSFGDKSKGRGSKLGAQRLGR